MAAAIPVGALTTAILVVNNLRDIPTDAAAGKRTLAVDPGRAARRGSSTPAPARVAFVVPVVLVAAGSADCRSCSRSWPCRSRSPLLRTVSGRSPSRASSTSCSRARPGSRSSTGCCSRPGLRSGARSHDRDPFARRRTGSASRSGDRSRPRPGCGSSARRGSSGSSTRTAGSGWARPSSTPADGEVAETILTALVREAGRRRGAAGCRRWPTWRSTGRRAGRSTAALERRPARPRRRRPAADREPTATGSGSTRRCPSLGPAAAAEAARQSVESGFATLKLKAGAERETEVLVERVRGDPDARSDPTSGSGSTSTARGTWRRAEDRLEAVARFDIEFVEQPLPAHDLDGLAELRRRVRVPIAADEAAASGAATSAACSRPRRSDVLVVKPARVGGPGAAAEIADARRGARRAGRRQHAVRDRRRDRGRARGGRGAARGGVATRWPDAARSRAGDGRPARARPAGARRSSSRTAGCARPAAGGARWARDRRSTSGRSSASGSTRSGRWT